MKFYPDSKKEIEAVFSTVISNYFKDHYLEYAKFQYVFWEGVKATNDGRIIRGETRIPSPRERDIYDIDFIIAINGEYWDNEASTKDKIRLAYHELYHCIVEVKIVEGKTVPKRDKESRLKVKLKPHDINLNLFLSEVEEVGLTDEEYQYINELYVVSKNSKNRRK